VASDENPGKETIMNKIARSILLAATVAAGASAAIAAPQKIPDKSDLYDGYRHNSQQGQRAFWEHQQNKGGN
jgi:hypothetical protein